MKIGSIKIDNFTVLAPLAGITNLPLRLLAKQAGCGLVCSEMISANGLVYGSDSTVRLMESVPEEKPLSVQIFGSTPSIMADAAKIVEASGADILDINFGCSVRKVLKTGSGSALMKEPVKTKLLLTAVRSAISIPLTIKIRAGWDPSGDQAVEIATIAQECGVDAVAVHPRTATQGFRGHSNWDLIKTIKQNLTIPVIGNGDVVQPEDAIQMKARTGCDAVMIGRAAIGNPLIFRQVLALSKNEPLPEICFSDRINMMIRYLDASVRYLGETTACYMMRSRLCWFVKGLRNATAFRKSIRFVSSEQEALEKIEAYRMSIADFYA